MKPEAAPRAPGDLKNYLRRWPRREVNVPAHIEIVVSANKKVVNRGRALIRNVSLFGALLSRIRLEEPVLPAQRFRIRVNFDLPDYHGVGALARPIHFGHDRNKFEIGIEFEDLWIGSE